VVDVQTGDGLAEAYLAVPGGDGPYPAVLLYMDAFGLRPQIEAMAERLASEGYVVLAPNVFYRDHEASLGTSDFGVLREYMKALTPDAVDRDARAYLDFLAAGDDVAEGPVGVTGYCMGGRLALLTAGGLPERVAAAASFHGGNLATDAPESPHRVADRIRAEVYVAHADQDRSMPPEQMERLEAALAGVTHRAEVYEGARHGFTMADLEVYDEAADQRHWRELLGLLGRTIGAARPAPGPGSASPSPPG
jgi:carboxymethylenebutenolidase